MEEFQEEFAADLATSKGNPLFFGEGLTLKDGRDTPYFVNIGGFSQTASGIWSLGGYFAGMIKQMRDEEGIPVDIISGPSYKASAIAQAAATSLYQEYSINLGFNYDRKEVKAHGEGSGAGTRFVGAKFFDGCNVIIVDDVGTSMRTKIDFLEKIQAEASDLEMEVKISGVLIGVDREQVGPVYKDGYDPKQHAGQNREWIVHGARGEDAIAKFTAETGIPVFSVLGVRQMMDSLCDQRYTVPFKHKDGSFTKVDVTPQFLDEHFSPYMEIYGARR
jgi:orotate phosphoribosyltransferase